MVVAGASLVHAFVPPVGVSQIPLVPACLSSHSCRPRRSSSSSSFKAHQTNDQEFPSDEQQQSLSNMGRRSFLASAAIFSSSSLLVLPNASNAAAIAAADTSRSSATTLSLPPMGLGAWAWGDSIFWGYNPKEDDDLHQVFNYALSQNLAFFDTAELYGLGRSETLIGNFREEAGDEGDKVQVATKFAALPFRTKAQDVVKACKSSLKRLNPNDSRSAARPIDLYQIHFPNAWANEEYWDGLAQCYEQGLVKSVGVSNYGVDAIRAVHGKLSERGIPLATNQIQLSLLYRFPIENGLIDTCNELGVKVLSYSPLALGFLTGKYDRKNIPTGPRQRIANTLFEGDAGASFDTMISVMKDISANHGDAPLSQVALNWTRAKGTIPIPGARNLRQAKQNFGALDWDLTKEEVHLLDGASSKVPAYITPDKSPFPKEDINSKLKMFDS